MTGVPILQPDQWQPLCDAHQARVEQFTADHLERSSRGEHHPVWDFIFHYYSFSPGKLKRWSPGAGVVVVDGPQLPFFTQEAAVRLLGGVPDVPGQVTALDVPAFIERNGATVRFIVELLTRTESNPAHFDCFGLHEWAMVYHDTPRHPVPLRLGVEGTNAVVESHTVRCTHYDAFRFFTPDARPLNEFSPTRQSQPACEQAGCVHAGMDLYKWAGKLFPALPSELWIDCLELAFRLRALDMQASPYDLVEWGFDPIPIETAAGKAQYVAIQRELSAKARVLRRRIVECCEGFDAAALK